MTTTTTKPAPASARTPAQPTRAQPRLPRPLKPHLQAMIDSDDIVLGERIAPKTPLDKPARAVLDHLIEEVAARRAWPTVPQLAARLNLSEKAVGKALAALRTAEYVQVIAWEPYSGSGARVPSQFGLVPGLVP